MVGKLVVKGIVRSVAIRKMKAALNGLLIEGLKTNVPLLKEIIKNENFVKGVYSTDFIEEEKPQDCVSQERDILNIFKKSLLLRQESRALNEILFDRSKKDELVIDLQLIKNTIIIYLSFGFVS